MCGLRVAYDIIPNHSTLYSLVPPLYTYCVYIKRIQITLFTIQNVFVVTVTVIELEVLLIYLKFNFYFEYGIDNFGNTGVH